MDKRIVKVLNYIESNISCTPELHELADMACLSTSQFHAVFKKETGFTPFQFIEKIKIEYAYDEITLGTLNIADLAVFLGYKDTETFSRAFKRHHKLSPGDLKSISEKLASEIHVKGHRKLLMAAFDTDELSADAMSEISHIIKSNNLSDQDLQDAHIFTVSEKSEKSIPENLIKNKFEIAKDIKIWQKLMQLNQSQKCRLKGV